MRHRLDHVDLFKKRVVESLFDVQNGRDRQDTGQCIQPVLRGSFSEDYVEHSGELRAILGTQLLRLEARIVHIAFSIVNAAPLSGTAATCLASRPYSATLMIEASGTF